MLMEGVVSSAKDDKFVLPLLAFKSLLAPTAFLIPRTDRDILGMGDGLRAAMSLIIAGQLSYLNYPTCSRAD